MVIQSESYFRKQFKGHMALRAPPRLEPQQLAIQLKEIVNTLEARMVTIYSSTAKVQQSGAGGTLPVTVTLNPNERRFKVGGYFTTSPLNPHLINSRLRSGSAGLD